MQKESPIRYSSIDGLRVIACLGIILMHIQANTNYLISDNFFDIVIPSFTWFVYLFFLISGFGMCNGYLDKFISKEVDVESFYIKRYKKTLPFFAFLLIIACILDCNISTIYEASIEVLLIHGLLPNNDVSVIGVSWTLGVIFLFYFLFPIFTVLVRKKTRAWISLVFSLWIVFVCDNYFFSKDFVTSSFTPRHNFLYCAPFFIAGAIIYLYKNKIQSFIGQFHVLVLIVNCGLTVLWYYIPDINGFFFYIKTLIVLTMWLIYAIGYNSKVLSSKIMRRLSNISLEMYLAQMVIFRLVEKANLLYIFGKSDWFGYVSLSLCFILVVSVLVLFIYTYKKIFQLLQRSIYERTIHK